FGPIPRPPTRISLTTGRFVKSEEGPGKGWAKAGRTGLTPGTVSYGARRAVRKSSGLPRSDQSDSQGIGSPAIWLRAFQAARCSASFLVPPQAGANRLDPIWAETLKHLR